MLAGRRDAVRVAIFNVIYSPNLGDGVIAECLEAHLSAPGTRVSAVSVDLAGRVRFDPASGAGRARLLRVLEALPPRARAFLLPIAIAAVVRLRLEPRWRRVLQESDVAVIGGGALLADADQNFPIKLATVLSLCAELGIPVAIAHVGVTRGWSAAGKRRLRSALRRCEIVKLTVRDDRSIDAFIDELGAEFGRPERALDPGLLACDTYGAVARTRSGNCRKRIGLCVTNPLVLRLHGEIPVQSAVLAQWLRHVIAALAHAGHEVVVFTNGSPEDELFADALLPADDLSRVFRAIRPVDPAALVRIITSCDCVVAHRLHACIVAYSYDIPVVGLTWDPKLDSFFRLAKQEAYLLHPGSVTPDGAVSLVEQAVSRPLDPRARAELLQDCRVGIDSLLSALAARILRHA